MSLDDELASWDFPWLITMDELLVIIIKHCAAAQDAQTSSMLEAHLKMASRAMRCALEVYGMRLEKENGSEEQVHSDAHGGG